MEQGSSSHSTSTNHGDRSDILEPKHKVFLSHSGAQKGFVEQLCVDLERCDRYPFFDKRWDSLPIGKEFPPLIFEAIEQCEVGVLVLSEEFFTSKWPMLELMAMANVKKQKPSFTIMPILLGITFFECRDPDNHKRWSTLWHTWAQQDSRIDVKEWVSALQLFGPTNALKYNLELGEVKFREEIVDAICALVHVETRFEDSYIQGKDRLCKVIYEAMAKSKSSILYGVHIVGLYGDGGIGKTTICKAMCNHLSLEYRNKVAHVELGSQSEKELLKKVLGRLIDKSLHRLGEMDVGEYHDHLKRDMMNAKVFLAIDNVSSEYTDQALTLLRAKYGLGSVVFVIARSLDELMALSIDASVCMEMPELDMEEARSLFLHHALCVPSIDLSNIDDYELISSCVKRCHFKKGDNISYHYHPLALQVLGVYFQGIGYVPKKWRLCLDELDFLNHSRKVKHPIFSILRTSFDALNPQDQLLFMDVALFTPYYIKYFRRGPFKWSIFKWLGMVHRIHVEVVMDRLKNLKKKSVLGNLGNGFNRIGMHDLWREFAKLETKHGEYEEKRWMFEWDEYNELEEGSLTNGGHFVKMRWMFFKDEGFKKLKDVNFSCFPNVVVLKLNTNLDVDVDVDLGGLKHLKSLEWDWKLYNSMTSISLVGLSSLLELGSLRWRDIPSNSPCIDEISCLTNLQVLDLYQCGCFPDLSSLHLLQVACFNRNDSMITFTGLSLKHTNLQILDLSYCKALESCPGVDELVALEELCFKGCFELKEVPNFEKLIRLRKLDVGYCPLLTSLSGLSNLVNLVELIALSCLNLVELPNMHNLQKLRILDLSYSECIKSLPGLNELVCLQSLKMLGCKNLTEVPDVSKLTNLQTLALDLNRNPQACTEWSDLISLRSVDIEIDELHDGPNLCKFTKLEKLHISGWRGQGCSSLGELVLLESLTIDNCKGMHVLPNLKRLSRLRDLTLETCEFEDLSGLKNVMSLEELKVTNCDKLEALPDLQELVVLRSLMVKGGTQLRDVHGIFGLHNLESLELIGHPWLHENLCSDLQVLTNLEKLDLSDGGFKDLQVLTACSQLYFLTCARCPIQEFPDLTNFPELLYLDVCNCVNLTELTYKGPLNSDFYYLNVSGCTRLQALPDLTNAQKMETLNVSNSGILLSIEFIQDMKVRWPSIDVITQDTSSSPSIDLTTQDISSSPSNDLIMQDTSSPIQPQRRSRGIWRRSLEMISSLHCGCIQSSSRVLHPN